MSCESFKCIQTLNFLDFRVCITVLCVVSVLWVPLVQSSAGGQLFVYIQAIQGYLGTAIGPVFVLAVFWKRATESVSTKILLFCKQHHG